jgi:hypothetical protein
MPYSRRITKTGDQARNSTAIKFMKTNTIQVITTTVAIAFAAGFAGTKVTGNYLTGVGVAVAYLAVAALVAIAASDYRGSQRAF